MNETSAAHSRAAESTAPRRPGASGATRATGAIETTRTGAEIIIRRAAGTTAVPPAKPAERAPVPASIDSLLALAETKGKFICAQNGMTEEEFLDYGFRQIINSILEVRI